MLRRTELAVAALAVVVVSHALSAGATPQEEKRKKLLEQLGLEKKPPAPPAAPTPPPAADDAAPEPEPDDKGPTGGEHPRTGERPAAPAAPSFRRAVHPLLLQSCRPCHSPTGPAKATRLLLSDDPAADHPAVARLVDARNPAASVLLAKAGGQTPHGGGALWPAGSPQATRVLAWITAGAHLDGGRKTQPQAEAPVATPAPAPAAPKHAAAPKPETPPASAAPPVPAEPTPPAPAPTPASANLADEAHALLVERCSVCHRAGGMAAATRLVLGASAADDLAAARRLVDAAAPEQSLLVTKAGGEMHAGGPVLPAGSAGREKLIAWARAGEEPATSNRQSSGTPDIAGRPLPVAGRLSPVASSSPTPPPAAHPAPGLALPYGFNLSGRFSLDYERGNFTGAPTADGATNALRSYHHFLFLSRESAEDRFGMSAEILSLLFWEAHVRLTPGAQWWQLSVAGGKILVPFGADPLTHQSYGGLQGFDQKILPVVWAQEGAAAHFVAHRRELSVSDDLYVVRGYALRRADSVINLQNDFSPEDDSKLGFGNRVGLGWGPLSAWYSLYGNRLGFGLRLFMQAADIMLWRVRGVPVLDHLSFAAGVLRADVSGGDAAGVGGPGLDYYHFGSYFQVRYHPSNWLYILYRQGLRTFDNRRGVIVDDTRLTSDDASTHTFGVVARAHGASAGVFYFVNLEKGTEIPNDLLRVSLTYEF